MNYEWFQDDNQIKLRFQIKNTKSDNLDIQVDVVVKVNVLDKKFAKTIDLLASVLEGNIKYGADILENQMVSIESITFQRRIDLKKKRCNLNGLSQDFFRKDQEIQAQKKLKEDLKHQFDQHSTKEQIKVDAHERNLIIQKQEQQKTEAISDLYHKIMIFLQMKILKNKRNKQKALFQNQEKQQQKFYPHLAAREQHFKDAPVPRQNNIPITEQRENPLFLKDKLDEFFRNKDYYSAINAYLAAFKYDNQLFTCIANRAACYLALFNFQECSDDCQTIINLDKKN